MPRPRSRRRGDWRTPEQRASDRELRGLWWRCPDHGVLQDPVFVGDRAYCDRPECETEVLVVHRASDDQERVRFGDNVGLAGRKSRHSAPAAPDAAPRPRAGVKLSAAQREALRKRQRGYIAGLSEEFHARQASRQRGRAPEQLLRVGECRECGCTDGRACEDGRDGCHWVDDRASLCSACADGGGADAEMRRVEHEMELAFHAAFLLDAATAEEREVLVVALDELEAGRTLRPTMRARLEQLVGEISERVR